MRDSSTQSPFLLVSSRPSFIRIFSTYITSKSSVHANDWNPPFGPMLMRNTDSRAGCWRARNLLFPYDWLYVSMSRGMLDAIFVSGLKFFIHCTTILARKWGSSFQFAIACSKWVTKELRTHHMKSRKYWCLFPSHTRTTTPLIDFNWRCISPVPRNKQIFMGYGRDMILRLFGNGWLCLYCSHVFITSCLFV